MHEGPTQKTADYVRKMRIYSKHLPTLTKNQKTKP